MPREEIEEMMGRLDHLTQAIWAADCAQHVLPYFQDLYPWDQRPRYAIDAVRSWARGDLAVSKAREAAFASHAAARAAEDSAACAAARAAGHAAATAHVAGHAIHAARYAAKAAACHGKEDGAELREVGWQYQRLCLLTSEKEVE